MQNIKPVNAVLGKTTIRCTRNTLYTLICTNLIFKKKFELLSPQAAHLSLYLDYVRGKRGEGVYISQKSGIQI